jgi:hypothetical protein
MDAIDAEAFRAAEPYPWINPEGLLDDEGYRRLLETLPTVDQFEGSFGKARKFDQQSHDRYNLEYKDDTGLSEPWRDFISELRSEAYGSFLQRLFGTSNLDLRFHWHYTPSGCSVSPHCDSKHKLASHIFYFNTAEDWDPTWGGETLILEDHGRFPRKSAPRFEDFDQTIAADALGNRSLLFRVTGQSWHGVKEIHCPEDRLRKVFIVVINRTGSLDWLRAHFGRSREAY